MPASMKPAALVVACLAIVLALAGLGLGQEDLPRRDVNLTLQDEGCPAGPDRFCVQPAEITLEQETNLVLNVENAGRVEHNLTFPAGTPAPLAGEGMQRELAPNETERLRIPWSSFEEGLGGDGVDEVRMHCGLSGHASLGEVLLIRVPGLAEQEENPQPGPGALGAVVGLAAAGVLARRAREG